MGPRNGASNTLPVKLGGQLGRMLYERQLLDWDILRSTGEYHPDYEEAVEIFCIHFKQLRDFGAKNG
jgi:hypothetical protein